MPMQFFMGLGRAFFPLFVSPVRDIEIGLLVFTLLV
jgi:hypothetical protein